MDGGDGSVVGIPCPRAPHTDRGYPKAGEGINTMGVPSTPLPGAPSDGIPISFAFHHVAHDAHKGRCSGDHPTGDTIHGMAEGSDGRSVAGHCRPCQRGPLRHQAGAESGDKDKPCTPTRTSTSTNLGLALAGTVPAARNPGPTTCTSIESGDAHREVGRGPKESPLDM